MAHGYPKDGKYRGGGDRSARTTPKPSRTQTSRTHKTVKTDKSTKR